MKYFYFILKFCSPFHLFELRMENHVSRCGWRSFMFERFTTHFMIKGVLVCFRLKKLCLCLKKNSVFGEIHTSCCVNTLKNEIYMLNIKLVKWSMENLVFGCNDKT
ncbi:hypothetical protein KFK09_020820 [Dendrobium nobile]|uniref:Uncharacterized protein n=1 Tax=Dendrobium nobile TaxID=94219 RepID=A0A8T3AME3_DENNO|nr:hypothetical protein KFK09_020820 [Dendrobium nobile]